MILYRLKAFGIDYCIIVAYIGLLLGATLIISRIFQLQLQTINPVTAELIGFGTLTLPVILYFTLSENSKYAGTIGKRRVGLQIVNNSFLTKASIAQLVMRNCIKFLPWELAHFFIYRLFYFVSINQNTPPWVLAGLIVSQVIALIYFLCIIFTKNHRSIYEFVSKTKVIKNKT